MEYKPSWLVLALLIFIMSLLFALNGVVIMAYSKYEQVHPITFLVLRNLGGSGILFLFAYQAKQFTKLSLKCYPPLLLFGLLLYLNQLCFLVGLYHTNPPISIMFQQLVPPMVTFLSIKVGLEKGYVFSNLFSLSSPLGSSEKRRFWGMIFSLTGALWLVSFRLFETTETKEESEGKLFFLVGEFLFLVNSLCFAAYLVLQKSFVFVKGTPIEKDEEMGDKINITPEINYTENMKNQAFLAQINAFCDFSEMSLYFVERPILFIAWVYAMSGGFFVVTATGQLIATGSSFLYFSAISITPILYSAVITTGVCYGIMTFCSKHLSASALSSFLPLEVALSCLLSAGILGTKLAGQEYVGCSLIIFGLFLVTQNEK